MNDLKKFENMLKASLVSVYYNDPEIAAALAVMNYEKTAFKFKTELLNNISLEKFNVVDNFLRSDEYKEYKLAVDKATLATTQQLAEMISLVVADKGAIN